MKRKKINKETISGIDAFTRNVSFLELKLQYVQKGEAKSMQVMAIPLI